MPRIDYDSFRAKSFVERLTIFNVISAEERAELVRTHISRWLSQHRHELSDEQIKLFEEIVAFISTDLYASPANPDLVSGFLGLSKRAAMLLSHDQLRDSLYLSWDRASATAAR